MANVRRALIAIVGLAMTSAVIAQQPKTQYLIATRVIAGNPQDSGSMQVLAKPTFRVAAGQPATLDLGDQAGGIRLVVTPSDLGEMRTALHVFAEARTGARSQTSTFDVLTGPTVSIPTVAPRDATGAFLLEQNGRALFIEFTSVMPVR